MSDIHSRVAGQLQRILSAAQGDPEKLNSALRCLAKYRSLLIQNTIIAAEGVTVLNGPFKGMEFIRQSAEGCHVPKLLGCYEAELHPYILAAVDRGYDTLINIGSAEGYYAVGLARLMPKTAIIACDSNTLAQRACRELAEKNRVSDRIVISGEFRGDDFEAYAAHKTFVLCDIEGAETMLLDPERFPALRQMDLIVELHDSPNSKASRIIPERFVPTHHIEMVGHSGRNVKLPSVLERLGHLDQLLSVWEWRSAPTPWAVMLAK